MLVYKLPWPNWATRNSHLPTASDGYPAYRRDNHNLRDYKLSTLRIRLNDHDIEWVLYIYQPFGYRFFRTLQTMPMVC